MLVQRHGRLRRRSHNARPSHVLVRAHIKAPGVDPSIISARSRSETAKRLQSLSPPDLFQSSKAFLNSRGFWFFSYCLIAASSALNLSLRLYTLVSLVH
jgi:hypothetical protein